MTGTESRVVVIGGGFGGLAAALRLAKLGHDVTVLEAAERIGGALGRIAQDGFAWDTGPTGTVLPAVVRDLFRKSGRPLEKELDLVPVEPMQQHRWDDVVLDLPHGRAAQIEAVEAALGRGAGNRWAGHVDDFAEVWEALRPDWFEQPWSEAHASADTRRLLRSRLTLHKLVRREFKDPRLHDLALQRVRFEGHDPRNVPAWVGVWSYLEQTFGTWTVPGGMGRLVDVLTDRLGTRGVTVCTSTTALDLVVEGGRVRAVRTAHGEYAADHVVCAVDPRRLPALRVHVEQTMPALPPVVCHLGIAGDVPDLPAEVVLHGDPMLVIRTTGTAPPGAHAWTVLGRGKLAEDVVVALQRAGIAIRDQVETRIDRSPRDLVEAWHGSPNGVLWQGRGTVERRLGTRTPIDGVVTAGAHAVPGAGMASVGLSAALVAQVIGPA